MAFSEQIDKLVATLTDLTTTDKVAWQETASENIYLANVGKFGVVIGRTGSDAYAGFFFRILNGGGRTIEEALATLVAPGQREAVFQDWDRLRSLYDLARRRALQADKAVSELLSSLEQLR